MDGNWSPWITSLANWVSSQYSPNNSGRQPSPLSGLPGFGYPQAGPTIATTAPPVQPAAAPAAPAAQPATPLWLQMGQQAPIGQMPAYDPTGGIPAGGQPPAPRARPVMPPLPQPRPPEAAMAAAPPLPQADPNAIPTFGQFLSNLGSIPGKFTQDLLGTTNGPSLIDSLLAKLKGASFGSPSGGGLYPMGQDQ